MYAVLSNQFHHMFVVHQLRDATQDVFFNTVQEVQEAFSLLNRFPFDSSSIFMGILWDMHWIGFQVFDFDQRYEFLKVLSNLLDEDQFQVNAQSKFVFFLVKIYLMLSLSIIIAEVAFFLLSIIINNFSKRIEKRIIRDYIIWKKIMRESETINFFWNLPKIHIWIRDIFWFCRNKEQDQIDFFCHLFC